MVPTTVDSSSREIDRSSKIGREDKLSMYFLIKMFIEVLLWGSILKEVEFMISPEEIYSTEVSLNKVSPMVKALC